MIAITMTNANTSLAPEDADRFRAYERQRHDSLATTYHDFFTPVTALAIRPLLNAVQVQRGAKLLDVGTGPGSLAAMATGLGINCTGVDLSPGMIELAKRVYAGIDFRVAEVEHLPFTSESFDSMSALMAAAIGSSMNPMSCCRPDVWLSSCSTVMRRPVSGG